jgi:hypothetical protein
MQRATVKKDEPVCIEGTWAMEDDMKKYVCLSWFYRGRLYTPAQLQWKKNSCVRQVLQIDHGFR